MHREHGQDYREGGELSWCPSWSNSLWQGWSCGLVYCPGGNATDPIWRVLASSLGISSGTPLKPQHSSPNPNPWPINSGVLTSLLLPHLSSSLTDSLPSLNLLCHSKTDAGFMQDGRQAVWSIPYISVAFLPSLKQNFIAYRYSKVSYCIFDIHQLWQWGFSRVYSNCSCSCSFEAEIIKIGQSSHRMYSNNIMHFEACMIILNDHTKKSYMCSFWWVNYRHFKWSISRLRFICFRFYLLCAKLESVGHCLQEKQLHDAIQSTRKLLYCLAFTPGPIR